jgi:hypothetical protein
VCIVHHIVPSTTNRAHTGNAGRCNLAFASAPPSIYLYIFPLLSVTSGVAIIAAGFSCCCWTPLRSSLRRTATSSESEQRFDQWSDEDNAIIARFSESSQPRSVVPTFFLIYLSYSTIYDSYTSICLEYVSKLKNTNMHL